MLLRHVTLRNCYAGLVIGDDPNPPFAVFRIERVPRQGWDRLAAIKWLRATAASFPSGDSVANELLAIKSLD
jgi:hypothetical protein